MPNILIASIDHDGTKYQRVNSLKGCFGNALSSYKDNGVRCQQCFDSHFSKYCDELHYRYSVLDDMDKRIQLLCMLVTECACD